MVYIVHTGRHTHGKWQYSCRILLPALWFWVFWFFGVFGLMWVIQMSYLGFGITKLSVRQLNFNKNGFNKRLIVCVCVCT